MEVLVEILGGVSLILFCALIFGEIISGSSLLERPTAQTVAVLLIMLLGAGAGVLTLGAIMFYGLTPTGAFGKSGLIVQVLGVCAGVLMLGGAFIARANLRAAGLLLGLGCLGLLITYGFNRMTGTAIALAAIAASSALVMAHDGHAPTWSRRRI